MFAVQDPSAAADSASTPSNAEAGGAQGLLDSDTVKALRSWAWWAFKKGGDVTWILTTTGIVVVFPLYYQIARDMAIAEAETAQVQQLQQQGYNQHQINQMISGQMPMPQR